MKVSKTSCKQKMRWADQSWVQRADRNILNPFHRIVLLVALILAGILPVQGEPKGLKPGTGSGPKAAQVVIIGASYAKGWNPAELAGLKVVNRGVGGEQTHEVLARFDRDVLVPAPRAVIIWGFINDIFRSTPEELEKKLVRSRDNITVMIDKAQRRGITPILATEVTLPVRDGWYERVAGWIGSLRGKQGHQDYVNSHVLEMNSWLRRLAAEKKLTLLDFEKLLADSSNRRKLEYATPDGTHLSPQAYEALTYYTQRMQLGV